MCCLEHFQLFLISVLAVGRFCWSVISRGPVLPEADQQILRDLMSDAMEEIDMQEAASSVKPQSNGETDPGLFP